MACTIIPGKVRNDGTVTPLHLPLFVVAVIVTLTQTLTPDCLHPMIP
ncbi:hypothetical protein C8R21_10463 [Nitrosospira multiformis]|uniref:Uncharacterized protein n=1 Tax=Nitrosospira multiformis TaxID=1231 RepID=A0A2T5IFB5_9PROT|nr:hypothetical protein C8R21_10463 [Nitrosospira multiformis]